MRVLLASNTGFQYLAAVLPELQRLGVETRTLSVDGLQPRPHKAGRPRRSALNRYYFNQAFLDAYRAEIDVFKPDVVHITGIRASLIKTLAACRPYKHLGIVHERISAGGMNPFSPLDWWLFSHRRIDRIIMPSHAMLNNWMGSPFLRAYIDPARCEVLHYAFETPAPATPQQRSALRQTLGFDPDAFVIGTVCYIREWKNVEFVADVVSSVRTDRNLCFAVIGPANPNAKYMDRIRAVGGDRLKLVGYIPNARTMAPAFDLHVTPTRLPGESFGMAFAEAMACGIPGLTMNYGASAEVCESGISGFALPPSKPVWRRTIEELMADPAKLQRLGQAARRRIEERFSPEETAREYFRVYQSVVTARTGAASP